MAKAGRVQHWKHGWIPVSPEAKAFAAGKGPRPVTGAARAKLPMPGDRDYSPNNEFGIPTSHRLKDDRTGAQVRLDDLKDVVPDIRFRPQHAFASQNMAARYTGGVVLDAPEADRLLEKIETNHEGMATRLDSAEQAGFVSPSAKRRLTTNTAKGDPEEQARRRARRLKNYLGLDAAPYPDYERVNDALSGAGRYTGGLAFPPSVADELVEKLNDMFTGTMSRYLGRRASGMGA